MAVSRQSLDDRIDAFFAARAERDGWVQNFLQQLHESYASAEAATHRNLMYAAAAYLGTLAVGWGLVNEAELGSFKVSAVKSLLPAGPLLLGLLSYTTAQCFMAATNLHLALVRVYKHVLPEACRQDLEMLVGPAHLLSLERRFTPPRDARLLWVAHASWYGLLVLAMWIGFLVAIVHTTVLAQRASTAGTPVIVGCSTVAGLLWLRATLSWVTGVYFGTRAGNVEAPTK